MKWVCQEHCYWNKRWRPGDIYEGTSVDKVPAHFEPISDDSMIDVEKEIVLLRAKCQEAGIFFERDWGVTELENAYKSLEDVSSTFGKPSGRSVLATDRGIAKAPLKRPALMKKCKELEIPVKITDTTDVLLKKLADHEASINMVEADPDQSQEASQPVA